MKDKPEPTPTPRTDKCLTFDSIALCETLERELAAVAEQRDKYRDIASELIAMIRINVISDTFKIATIEQVDEHLKPWIERIAAVKGGADES